MFMSISSNVNLMLGKAITQTSTCLYRQKDLRVVDYQKNCLMLRILSGNLWEGVSCVGTFVASLHSVADSLFKQVIVNLSLFCVVAPSWIVYSCKLSQIIFAHKNHFKEEDFHRLQAVLFQQTKNYIEVCASSFYCDYF